MRKKIFWSLTLATASLVIALQFVAGQGRQAVSPDLIARRHAIESELQSIAIV